MDWKQFKGRVNREIRSKVVSTIMAVVIHPQQPCEQFLAVQRSASWHSQPSQVPSTWLSVHLRRISTMAQGTLFGLCVILWFELKSFSAHDEPQCPNIFICRPFWPILESHWLNWTPFNSAFSLPQNISGHTWLRVCESTCTNCRYSREMYMTR